MAKPLNLIQSLNQLKAQLSGGAAASDEALILIKAEDKVGRRKVLHMSGNVLDVDMTMTVGNLVKVVGWYDNEAGYSARLADLATRI